MSDQSPDKIPELSPEEMQLAVARVAFRLAQLSQLVERHLGPKNALMADPDPYATAQEASRIRKDMMKLTGYLLGEEDNV